MFTFTVDGNSISIKLGQAEKVLGGNRSETFECNAEGSDRQLKRGRPPNGTASINLIVVRVLREIRPVFQHIYLNLRVGLRLW